MNLQLDGRNVLMEVDTGASLSLMSQTTFRQLWPKRSLQPSDILLRTYTVESLKPLGTADVTVRGYSTTIATLPLLVVATEGPSLLGRNWLEKLRLDWRQLNYFSNNRVNTVLQRHTQVFKEELGTLKGCKAAIHVDPTATPRFCKARTVPYAMRGLVEKELERLVRLGIIEYH